MDPETSLEEGSSKVNPLFHLDEDATKPLQLLGHKRILGGWLETTVNENSKSKVIKKCSKTQNQLARPTIRSGILFSIPTIGRASEQVREEVKPKKNIFKEAKPEVQEDMTVKRPNNTRESDPSSNATGGESENKYSQTDQLNQILSGYLKNSNGKNWHEAELCDTVLRLRHARQEALLAAQEASEIREETLAAKRDALKARKEATQALTEVFKARQETAEAIEEISGAKMRMSVMLRLSEEHLNSSKAQKDEKDKCNSSFKRSTKKSSLTAQKRARKTKSSEGNETIIIPTSLGLTPSCSKTPGLMATEPHVSTIQTKQNWDHIEHLPSSPETFPKVGASPESQKSLGVSIIGRLKQSSDIEQNCSDKTGLNNSSNLMGSLIQPSTTKCKDFVDICDKTEDSVAIMESDSDSDDSKDTSEDAMQNSPVALPTNASFVQKYGDLIGRLSTLMITLVTAVNTGESLMDAALSQEWGKVGTFAFMLLFIHTPVIVIMFWLLLKEQTPKIKAAIQRIKGLLKLSRDNEEELEDTEDADGAHQEKEKEQRDNGCCSNGVTHENDNTERGKVNKTFMKDE